MLFAPHEIGQSLIEYAITIAFVAILVVAIIRYFGLRIGNTFSTIASSLPN